MSIDNLHIHHQRRVYKLYQQLNSRPPGRHSIKRKFTQGKPLIQTEVKKNIQGLPGYFICSDDNVH